MRTKLTQAEIAAQQEAKRRALFAKTAENKRLAEVAEARANAAVSMADFKKAIEAKRVASNALYDAYTAVRDSPTNDNLMVLGEAGLKLQQRHQELQSLRAEREAARNNV